MDGPSVSAQVGRDLVSLFHLVWAGGFCFLSDKYVPDSLLRLSGLLCCKYLVDIT